MNWRKSVATKKLVRYSYEILRPLYNSGLLRGADSHPAIIANSIPKSGTHLLIQILQAIEPHRDWGNFIASTPSWTYKELSPEKTKAKLSSLVSSEISGAHLFHSAGAEKTISERKIIHYFIYRDPRDICISEAYYLANMNRWHKLHRHFHQLQTVQERIDLSINGLPESPTLDYPHIGQRLDRYLKWIDSPNVCTVRYEDLRSPRLDEQLERIFTHFCQHAPSKMAPYELVARAKANINPSNSHTFRDGRTNQWVNILTKKQKERFDELAASQIAALGYTPATETEK